MNKAKLSHANVPQVRVVFMGTPALSQTLLEALIGEHYNVVGVVTRPDKPVGRDQSIQASPVKATALKHQIPVLQPARLDAAAVKDIQAWKPDVILVAAYGRILPQTLLDIPGFGCVNVHLSLLPRWRGASPVQNALMAGDTETGVTLMLLDAGMDTGDILAQRVCPIDPHERADALLEKLTQMGQTLLLETLPLWVKRRLSPTPQPTQGVTLCQLIEREDGRIVWDASAQEIYNRFRGLYPWPGVFTFWKRGEDDIVRLKLTEVAFQKLTPEGERPVGQVFEIGDRIGVQTGEGVIFLETLQLEGKTVVPVRNFLQGNPQFIGTTLM